MLSRSRVWSTNFWANSTSESTLGDRGWDEAFHLGGCGRGVERPFEGQGDRDAGFVHGETVGGRVVPDG